MSKQNHKFKETEIGMIPEDWEVTTLEDISSIVTDGSHFSPKEATLGNKIMATVKNMKYNSFDFSECKRISDTDFKALTKNNCSPEKGDILISKDGANCLDIIFVYNQEEKVVILSSIAIVRLKTSYNPVFYRYFLLSPNAQKIMREGYVSGSAIPRVVLKDFKKVPVPRIPQGTQNIIASILSSLDDKIELNQQMNATLEKIGQALFKHWFIDFEFPDEKGRSYKSSGGEMVDSELGKIPKGWEVKSLSEVADFIRGFSYNGTEKSKIAGELVFVTLNSIYEGGGFKREFSYLSSNRLKEHHFVREGDIVIANTEQTKTGTLLGFPGLVEFPYGYTKEKGCFSHHITKVSPRSENMKYFFYYHLFINQEAAVKYHTGSVIWALDVNGWSKNEKIAVPNDYLLNVFSIFAKALFEKRLSNAKESFNLSSIRDSLLPRLMSGRIRVNTEVLQ